jgi:hypothetical protein
MIRCTLCDEVVTAEDATRYHLHMDSDEEFEWEDVDGTD